MTAFALNMLAVQNAEVLRELHLPTGQRAENIKTLAERIGRDDSNLGKTIRLLVAEGLVIANPLTSGAETTTLTIGGAEQLAAIARAEHGGERRKPRGSWPIDKLRRNPTNRHVDPDGDPGLADTIVAAGGILMPLLLSPPDANGVRTIWAGERRWRAAQRLAREGALPDSLAGGLPFTEREATEAEALLIALIENGAREDENPLDEAEKLAALAAATGWSAREVAKKTGRSPEGSETGVRDVQVKIKIAREATDEAKAEYRRTQGWDALKASVTEPRPAPVQTSDSALIASGSFIATGSGPIVHDAVTDALAAPTESDSADAKQREWWAANDRRIRAALATLKPKHLLVLLEIADACIRRPYPGYSGSQLVTVCREDQDGPSGSIANSLVQNDGGVGFGFGGGVPAQVMLSEWTTGWLDDNRYLTPEGVDPTRLGLVRQDALGIGAEAKLRAAGRYWTDWLNLVDDGEDAADPLVVNGKRYPNLTRANEARRLLGLLPNQANHGGGARLSPDERAPGRIATLAARYSLPDRKLPHGAPQLRIEIGRHIDGTWSFATGYSVGGEGRSYGLSFVEARERAIDTERGALIVAVNELRKDLIDGGRAERPLIGWLDDVLAGRIEPDRPQPTADASNAPPTAPKTASADDVDADGHPLATEADRRLLILSRELAANPNADVEQARELLEALGVAGPFSGADDNGVWGGGDGGIVAIVDGEPREIATVDVNGRLSGERADALAQAIAWALQRTFGETA